MNRPTKRQLLLSVAACAGMAAAGAHAAAPPTAKSDKPTTVIISANPPQLSRIAISPDARHIAYVSGRAGAQRLVYFSLDEMEPKYIELGKVFLTEMMWGSNDHVLLHLRYFMTVKGKEGPRYIQTGYIWRVINLTADTEKPYYLNADLSDMNRVETADGYRMAYDNKITYGPRYDQPTYEDASGVRAGLSDMSDLDQWKLEEHQVGGVSLLSDEAGATPKPYDEFDLFDLDTHAQDKYLSLDTAADGYAIAGDGTLVGYSHYDRSSGQVSVYFNTAPAGGKPAFKRVLARKAPFSRTFAVAGLGTSTDTLLMASMENDIVSFSELRQDGVLAPLPGTGRPLFDSYTHLLIGFVGTDTDAEPQYIDHTWRRIWTALKRMTPEGCRLKIESQAKDPRQLVISVQEKSGRIIYYYVDLSTGRTDLITTGTAVAPESAQSNK